MYTTMISAISATMLGVLLYSLFENVVLSVLVAVAVVLTVNILVGRHFSKKLTKLMNSVEKDLRAERIEPALEKLKKGYDYAKWQMLVKSQIDSQIGSILYIRKRFDEALPYLERAFSRNWSALCMLAAHHYRHKNYNRTNKTMERAISNNKKEPFPYSLYAYFLSEQKDVDKAIQILTKGQKKLPLDERISGGLDSLRNGKKLKIQNYGALWMQLHLGKSQDGAKSYQTFIANQKIRRR